MSVLVTDGVASELLNPSNFPKTPRGFGTGHSCAVFLSTISSSFDTVDAAGCTGSTLLTSAPVVLDSRCLIFLPCPSSKISTSESAKRTRGAGQGSMWGMATTRKDTASVAPKREEVSRDRG